MCGITGFWSIQPLADAAEGHLTQMTQRLYHRGPDGYGYHTDKDRGLAMGHARLSIIDLETGHQPLFSQDKKQVLTVNGEFYDYKRIRTRLRLDGARFETKSDSEIALPLYERKGLDFIDQLRGEFAFVLYDETQDRMILARDRFGIKPLFFYFNPARDFLAYGSEIKAIFAYPEVPRVFSPTGLVHQVMHTMVPGSSAFHEIYALKPGHMLIVDRKRDRFSFREVKYWDLDFPEEGARNPEIPAEDHIVKVQETLTEAVALRLEADVPVGCYLSGGIDSCSMLGLAASMQQSPVKAFTISFDHAAYDEAAIASEMAEAVGADQELLNLKAGDLYGENYLRTLWHAERTFYNTLGVAKWCMSHRVRECGYKVVVTGEGSDELFGGYPMFKRDMLRYGHQGKNPEEIASYQALMEKNNALFKGAILSEEPLSHPAFERICGFTPAWIQPWMQTLGVVRPLLNEELLNHVKNYDPVAAIAESFDYEQIRNRHFLDIAQYTWSKTMLECQILNWGGDRVDMANSMESRPAFLDHYVAEAAVKIPPHFRIHGNIEKWVLREAMQAILPEVLYQREKFAFMAPPGHTDPTKKAALEHLFDQFLRKEHIAEANVFDPGRMETFLAEYRQDKDPVSLTRKDAILNHILGIQILYKQFIRNEVTDFSAEAFA